MLLAGLAVYTAVGVVFGVVFVLRGAARIDPVAARTPLRVRVLFLPGAAALWPWLWAKWAGWARGAGR